MASPNPVVLPENKVVEVPTPSEAHIVENKKTHDLKVIGLSVIPANELALHVLETNMAYAKAGIHEATGHNDGEMIDKIEKVWGMEREPYCAMGQFYSFAKTLLMMNHIGVTTDNIVNLLEDEELKDWIAEKYLRFDPLVQNMIDSAKEKGQWHSFNQLSDVNKIPKGAYICFNFGTKSKPQNHIEQYDRWDHSHLWDIGWNTGSGGSAEGNDPSGGGGVFYKHREADPSVIKGWIDWM